LRNYDLHPLPLVQGLCIFCIGTLLLTACTYKSYHPEPIDLQQVVNEINSRDPHSLEFQTYLLSQGYDASKLPPKQWGLEELIFSALYFHPELDIARAKLHAAQAAEIKASERRNPRVSTNIEKHSQHENGISPWTYGLSIDIPIETANKRQARIDYAANLAEATRIEIAQKAWEIRTRIYENWLAWQYSRQRIAHLWEEHKLQTDIVSMLESRFKAGMASTMDLADARVRLQQLQQLIQTEESKLGELEAALANHAGLTLNSFKSLQLKEIDLTELPQSQTLSNISFDLPEALRQPALLNRLDIRAALARYDAAEARLRLEIARQYPDLELSPGYIYDQGDKIWTFGLSTLLSLLNRNEGAIAEAMAERELEKARIISLQNSIIGDLETRSAAYLHALTQLKNQHGLLESLHEQTRRSRQQFDQGLIDRLEWSTKRLEEVQSRRSLLDIGLRVHQANMALEETVQQPLLSASAMPMDFRLERED
jgi:cobalt-zinc-cadmium efflux system outer membrane protein